MALAQFQKAQALAPAPSLLYNIGRTYEALGRYHEAADLFDRYLREVGPAKSDDERQFQSNLAARSVADRQRPDRGTAAPAPPPPPQPLPQYAPYPYGYPPAYPYGYGAVPMAPPAPTRAMQLETMRGRRARGIALTTIGALVFFAGVGLAAATPCYPGCLAGGIVIGIAGPPLFIPGAVSWAKSQHKIDELSRPETPPPAPGLQSRIFSLPELYF
jgi:hypothetical protein